MSSPSPHAHTRIHVPYTLWLIIPVKPFGEGKSRLASMLSTDLRAEFSRRWLTHVLEIATTWGQFAGMAVVSRDAAVLEVGRAYGALPVVEVGDDLNAALRQAGASVAAAGAQGVLVLPSDLPLLTLDDLDALQELAAQGNGVIIAPSHDEGTNALLLRPPDAIPYAFGVGSFARHLALANAAKLPSHVYRSPTLALDIDRPEDLLLANG